MKTLIFLVLAVLGANAAVVKSPAARSNLNVGFIATGDRLLHSSYVYRPAMANAIQSENVSFNGNRTTRITAVQAQEVGASQYASAWIISGGIGQNNVTVRFQSAVGRGYYYLLSVWGR
ncbi:hypothetical protein O3G_MSEX010504 [Manduca sexta]|uniref:Salivary secreted peptide n=1 Tax=Manduca sexta TaxID=7130 RepID=A0A921ZHU0_MANSE|nr:hypothetical protein O3G_MSEX010504 [Manduca sexta]KAG6457795.1 hypothetical protein O3G_MSEX010504 [Manduca sexta]